MVDEAPTVEQRSPSQLKLLHETAKSVEKLRIQLGNRVSAIERNVDTAAAPVPQVYIDLATLADEMEGRLDDTIAEMLRSYPVWNSWLQYVRGIGPSLASQLLALLLPPLPDRGPSTWYKAAGLYVELRPDGMMRLPRARAGEGKFTYHPWLRRCLWNVGTSFVKQGGYYRDVYDRSKARLIAQHNGDPVWPPHRLNNVARWIAVKLFLAHLWEAWCAVEQFPARPPYPVEYQQHHYIPRPMPEGKGKI